jgi:hypothetical protein
MTKENKRKIKEAITLLLEVKATLKVDSKTCSECGSTARQHGSTDDWALFNGLCDAQDILYRLSRMED